LTCSVWRELEAHLHLELGLAELTKVAEAVAHPTLHDRRTWINAATALPH
jgi:hypothetical protein